MEVLGRKQGQDGGLTDITAWTLLGLCVDHFWKAWARHGGPAMLASDVYQRQRVKVCKVRAKGTQRWAAPGVESYFSVPEATLALALKLVDVAKSQLRARDWRVFDGDIDLVTPSGIVKGAVDGVADQSKDVTSLGLVELKVRALSSQHALDTEAAALCSTLDGFWSMHRPARLKTPWTHGILVVLCQRSTSRYFTNLDQCRVVEWKRGGPPDAPAARRPLPVPQPKAAPRPRAAPPPRAAQPPRAAAPQLVRSSPAARWDALLKDLRKTGDVSGDDVLLTAFLRRLQLPRHHTGRYLEGPSRWKLGDGRGRSLLKNTDWSYKPGRRGGGRRGQGHPHVKAGVLKDILGKYYANKQIVLEADP